MILRENSPIAQTVNLLLEYAIKSNASDIHIEPREDYVQVRYRIDGVLKEVNKLPRNVHGALVSRIKNSLQPKKLTNAAYHRTDDLR